jgi:hypothetical protein
MSLYLNDEPEIECPLPVRVDEMSSTCGRVSGRQPPFERFSTVPLIRASPDDVMPAENTRSREVMQKCDIDWPICNHEPAKKKKNHVKLILDVERSLFSPVSVTLKKNVIVITTCERISTLRQQSRTGETSRRTIGEAERNQEKRERWHS